MSPKQKTLLSVVAFYTILVSYTPYVASLNPAPAPEDTISPTPGTTGPETTVLAPSPDSTSSSFATTPFVKPQGTCCKIKNADGSCQDISSSNLALYNNQFTPEGSNNWCGVDFCGCGETNTCTETESANCGYNSQEDPVDKPCLCSASCESDTRCCTDFETVCGPPPAPAPTGPSPIVSTKGTNQELTPELISSNTACLSQDGMSEDCTANNLVCCSKGYTFNCLTPIECEYIDGSYIPSDSITTTIRTGPLQSTASITAATTTGSDASDASQTINGTNSIVDDDNSVVIISSVTVVVIVVVVVIIIFSVKHIKQKQAASKPLFAISTTNYGKNATLDNPSPTEVELSTRSKKYHNPTSRSKKAANARTTVAEEENHGNANTSRSSQRKSSKNKKKKKIRKSKSKDSRNSGTPVNSTTPHDHDDVFASPTHHNFEL